MASKPDELELFQSDVWNLPCSDKHLVLLSKLIADWREMAPYLSLTSTDEVDILTRYPHSAPCRRREMLKIWTQKNGPDATYKKLALIFQECDRKDLFSKINELVTSASSMSCEAALQADASTVSVLSGHRSLSPFFQHYVKYLKDLYIHKTTPIYDKEDDLLKVKAKSFINIALVHKNSGESEISEIDSERVMDRLHGHVDSIQKKKSKLCMCDVGKCEDGSVARCVLVEGCPGVGKTTFAYETCKQWARGEILQEWELVVIVKLRDQETREAKNLQDLLYHPHPEVSQAVVKELIDKQGHGMLLILDGYDELSDSQREFKSVIQQLMSRKLLFQATLMVMSRPLATRELHFEFQRSIDQHIEVLGFTEDNIQEYISSACGSNSKLLSDFKSYLSSHPFSSSLMFNPLQCAIVTDLYCSHWKCGDRRFAPKTLTELYTGLFHMLLLRHLTSNPDYSGSHRIRNLSELPEEVQQQVNAITELAARGIENRMYVFDEVDEKVPSKTLGLMQREDKLVAGVGRLVSYNFLHLTLQEYLAAVKYSNECSSPQQLSELLTEEKPWSLKRFLECYGKKRSQLSSWSLPKQYSFPVSVKAKNISAQNHWPLLLFIAGRTELQGISASRLRASFYDRTYSHETIVNMSLLHLLYETQSTQLIQSTLITSQKYLSVCGNSALDWFVIGFCIARSTSTWKVEKKLHIKHQTIDHLLMGLKLVSETSYVNNIGCLHIGDNYWLNILKILKWLQPYSVSVTEIKLFRQHQSTKEKHTEEPVPQIDLTQSTYYPALEKIEIEHANGNFLFSILDFQSQPNNLLSLSLRDCNLSIDTTSTLIHYLQSPHCMFHELIVERCTISMPSHSKAEKKKFCNLESLVFQTAEKESLTVSGLNQPNISCLVLQPFFIMKSRESDFPGTSLARPDIAKPFVSFSSQYNNLQSLSIIDCTLSWETFDALVCFLQSPNCHLRHLELDDKCKLVSAEGTRPTPCELKLELKDSGQFYLYISSSSQVIDCVLSSQPHFYASTLAELKIKTKSHAHSEAINLKFETCFPVLKRLGIEGKSTSLFPFFLSSLEENNLLALSLNECNLNHEATMLLIQFLQSRFCRLHYFSLSCCNISFTHKTNKHFKGAGLELLMKDTTRVSLKVTGNDVFISHVLSKLHFYASTLIRLVLVVHSQPRAATLKNVIVNYLMLAKLKVQLDSSRWSNSVTKFPILSIKSQQNNLSSLSLKSLSLSCDAIHSLFSIWQSPHSRLQKLSLKCCSISVYSDNCQQTEVFILKLRKLSQKTVCLRVHGSASSLFQLLSQSNFCTNILEVTEMRLTTSHSSDSSPSVVFSIPLYYPMLETLQIDQYEYWDIPPLPVVFDFATQPSNICFLSLITCSLNSLATRSIVDFLQSPHCKLRNLTLNKCIITLNDDTYELRLLQLKISKNISLTIAGSTSAVNCLLSQLQFYASTLTELFVEVTEFSWHYSSKALNIVPSNYPLLETLQFIAEYQGPILASSCLNFSSLPNTLHTFSIKSCKLNSEATSTLIHSLRSPHCVLSKLMLNDCDIFRYKETLLAAAIFSCSTLKNFLYDSKYTRWSFQLTEMISGIKHNQTIKELAIKNNWYSYSSIYNDDTKALVEAIDSSAVKTLWLRESYGRVNCLQFSRNVEIVFYSDDNDPFDKSLI